MSMGLSHEWDADDTQGKKHSARSLKTPLALRNYAPQPRQGELVPCAFLSANSSTLNSLSEVRFIVPHGTCLLSASRLYMALDEIYHPICARIQRQTTLRRHATHEVLQVTYGILTFIGVFSDTLTPAPPLAMPLQTTIQGRRPRYSS